jgi:hypothetical protein
MKLKKTDLVRERIGRGDFKSAMSIAKDFRLNISKEDSDAIKLAYECMIHERFYLQLRYNIHECIENGIRVLKKIYGGQPT